MFSFNDLDSDIQTRIPDRPARKVPVMISQMPEIPWLASKYEPRPSERPSIKSVMNKIVRNGIPLLGTLAVIAILGFGAFKLFSLY
jgi:hypothetical protein